jgi:uncharacterized protein (TIGR03437 family)
MSRLLLYAAFCCTLAHAQTPMPTVLSIDLQNVVEYQADISDPSKFATSPGVTPAVTFKNFGAVTILGDIVAVNGQPVKGLYVGRSRGLVASPTPAPGGAIADITRTALREHVFEILKSDGTQLGTLMSVGFSGGPAPPGTGSPSTQRANWAIVGGTGAFLGARGQVNGTGGSGRAASMAEDPANRRINGGTNVTFFLHIIPMSVPQILTTSAGPAIVHSSDFSPITAANPAVAGEILSLFATGLGPTNPDIDPGQPFPSTSLATVNSPVAVTVNGEPAAILAAVGYPGAVGSYQVNFQMPSDTAKGLATIQLSAAWIASTSVSIPVH